MTATAAYWCEHCQREIPAGQAEEVRAGTGFISVCPGCHRALGAQAAAPAERSFARVLAGAFAYAARPATLAWIAGMVLLAGFVSFVPLVGGLLSLIVLISYLFGVLRVSSQGEDDLMVAPDDIGDLTTWFAPLVRYLLTFLMALSPGLLAAYLTESPLLGGAGALLGLLYLPAGMIVAAHSSGCVGPLNPVPAAVIIGRIPGPYALTLAFLALAAGLGYGLRFLGGLAAGALEGVPFIPGYLTSVLGLLPAVVMARMLGLLVYEHGHEI
jgi:hypothetical protein